MSPDRNSKLSKATSGSSSFDSEKAQKHSSKSPMLACLPKSVLNKFSKKSITNLKSGFASYKDDIEDINVTEKSDTFSGSDSESLIGSQPPLEYEFNNVINFTSEEIVPTRYNNFNHDRINDEEIYAKHKINTKAADVLNPSQVNTTQRLERLRQLMKVNSVDVYIVPSEDAHQSEDTAPCDNRREYISGFSGSAGIAVISLTKAVLSTDSRYFLEAEKTLDNNWQLLKQNVEGYPTWQEWTISQLKFSKYKTLSVDPRLISLGLGNFFEKKCEEVGAIFKPSYNNFIDEVWDDQPRISEAPVYELPYKYTGKTTSEKIKLIRSCLVNDNATGIIITKLDDIAWTLNLRGSDFDNSPLFFSYLIITQDEVRFYIDPVKLPKNVESYLFVELQNLKIKEYFSFWIDLEALSINFENYYYLLPKEVSYGLVKKLSIINYKLSGLIEDLKSVKTPAELYGMKLSHVKDGIALARYFAWLEEKLIKEGRTLNEYQGAVKCDYYRSLMANYKGVSFTTISASGANAASNHYEPSLEINSIIDPKKVYLCDSGAQYLDGTTDITRTFHFSRPTKEEKTAYTAVLKGHIDLAMAQFPETTTGVILDGIARAPLWAEGLDYRHGTGHGIGSFLCVHEGPIYFGRNCTFKAGQIISDEPGYYKDYHFGIRIESDLEVMAHKTKNDLNGKPFLKFGYLTLAPFDRNLINKKKLTKFELAWINAYHAQVRKMLTPYLMKFNDNRAVKWLQKKTEPL
ncbi:hypothetical protein DASC09_056430 [Saccharomycopsis crataegensis]|uniref:Uncharacterized protein n=1 Tax=Saccharomycopsis crataegensis TaxID=43959 RepID=A0AAV5QUA7_9ASCO|nr:hypothetical protein DASC09_056430 [Saccharomycopsis crataegensis]